MVRPPPNAELLQRATGPAGATARVVVPGMGHTLPGAVLGPLADAVLEHVDTVERARG